MQNSNETNLTTETNLHYIIKTNIDGSLSFQDVYGDLSLIQQLGLIEYIKNEITKNLKFGTGVNPIKLTYNDYVGHEPYVVQHEHSKQIHTKVDEKTWSAVPDPNCVNNQMFYSGEKYFGPMVVGETITKNVSDENIDDHKLLKISDITNDKHWIQIENTSLFGNKLLSKFTPQIYDGYSPIFIGQDIYFGAILRILRIDDETNICEFVVYYVDFKEFKFSLLFSNTIKNLQDKLKFHEKLVNLLFDVKIAQMDFPEQTQQFLLLSKRKTSKYVPEPVDNLIIAEKMSGMEIKPMMVHFEAQYNKHFKDENVVGLNIDYFHQSKNWKQKLGELPEGLDVNYIIFQDTLITFECYVEIVTIVNETIQKIKIYMRENSNFNFTIMTHTFQESELTQENVFENLIIQLSHYVVQNFPKLTTTENLDSVKQLNILFESIKPKIDPLKIEAADIYGTPEAKFEHINDEAPVVNKLSAVNKLSVDNLIATNDWIKIKQDEIDFILSLNIFNKNIFSKPTNILFGINNNFGLFIIIDYKNFDKTNSIIKKYSIYAFDFISSNIINLGTHLFKLDESNLEEFSCIIQQLKEKHVKFANHPLSAGYPFNLTIKNILHSTK